MHQLPTYKWSHCSPPSLPLPLPPSPEVEPQASLGQTPHRSIQVFPPYKTAGGIPTPAHPTHAASTTMFFLNPDAAPGTFLLAPGIWHLAPGTWHLAPGTWLLALGTLHLASGTWHLAPGTWHQKFLC